MRFPPAGRWRRSGHSNQRPAGGEQALQALFVSPGAKQLKPRVLQYGRFMLNGQEIDDGMAVFFQGPHSYTGENSVEFQCHGSLAVVDQLLYALSTLPDFRPAEPGEFTKRAFLNGKMDLSQAEAVMDLIGSEGIQRAARQSLSQLHGTLFSQVDGLLPGWLPLHWPGLRLRWISLKIRLGRSRQYRGL